LDIASSSSRRGLAITMFWCCVPDTDEDSQTQGVVFNTNFVDAVSISEELDRKPPTRSEVVEEKAPLVVVEEAPVKDVKEEKTTDNHPAVPEAVVLEEPQQQQPKPEFESPKVESQPQPQPQSTPEVEVPPAEPTPKDTFVVDAKPPDELLPMYSIRVEKTDHRSFGAQFDLTDPDRPVIIKVLPDTHLGGGMPGPCPTVGSALVSVNDKILGGPDMVRKLRERGPISATFKEPRRRTFVLPKGEGSHGLDVKPTSSDELGLLVFACIGRASTCGLQVRDFIVEVGGQKGKPDALYDMLRNATSDIEVGVLTYNEEAKQRTVIIPQGDGPLGLEMKEVKKGAPTLGLYVLSSAGRGAAAGVRTRDTIIAVNNKFGTPAELYGLLRAGGKDMKLVISTPSS